MIITKDNALDYIGRTVKLQDKLYGKILTVYNNGVLTSAGFTDRVLELADNVLSVTYTSDAALYLPYNWDELMYLDDNNKRQKLIDIDFDTIYNAAQHRHISEPVYVMEDGTRSNTITITI